MSQDKTIKLSNQAMGSLMMALQKCLLEQSDITEILKEFKFRVNENRELMVMNPPIVKFEEIETSNLAETEDLKKSIL